MNNDVMPTATPHWRDGPLLAFDTETTEADPEEARLVSAAIIEIEGASITPHYWLINAGVPIPDGATAIHGITTAQVQAQGRPIADVLPEMLAVLRAGVARGAPIVAFNATYDLTLLDREARRAGLAPLEPGYNVVDPFIIDRSIDRYRRGSRKLVDVCAHYGVALSAGDAHGASADAMAAARLAWLLAATPSIAGLTLPQLYTAQVAWRRAQAVSLAEYDSRRGVSRPIQADWPLVPFQPAG